MARQSVAHDEDVHVTRFCIFVDSVCEGSAPLVRGHDGLPFVFATRGEAEREIADSMIDRLNEFMKGEREFTDAISVEEYVVQVSVRPDGFIVCEDGRVFGKA